MYYLKYFIKCRWLISERGEWEGAGIGGDQHQVYQPYSDVNCKLGYSRIVNYELKVFNVKIVFSHLCLEQCTKEMMR